MKNDLLPETPCLAPPPLVTVEARNAMRAETFRRLPEDIPLWRFREILTTLGAALGLSGGAVVYALDLTGMLTEADWRGDGRAVTYHSVRSYARKVGKSERTICTYERQLIAAGLVHRTARHARRHGGGGDERRRTGLDWRSFGVLLPDLIARLDTRRAEEQRRLDLEARIRAERRLVLGLAQSMEEGRGTALQAQLGAMGVLRLCGTPDLPDLERRLAALTLLRTELVEELPVDNPAIPAHPSDMSEETGRHKDTTEYPSCPTDIRRRAEKKTTPMASPRPPTRQRNIDQIPLERLWQAAPERWRTMLGTEVPVTWPVLIEIADYRARELEVSAPAWSQALHDLGPSEAAVALLILDRNRDHPLRPVRSVGGALMGMIRRAGEGELNLTASVHGVLARCGGQVSMIQGGRG